MDEVNDLLSRVADREEAPGDWLELERRAARDPEVWRRLARTLRDDCALRAAGEELAEEAAGVGWPEPRAARRLLRFPREPRRLSALAASFAAGALSVFLSLAGRDAIDTPHEVADAWAPLVVDARPSSTGEGVEVTYVRPVLEREVVPALYELDLDENDRTLARPVESVGLQTVTFL